MLPMLVIKGIAMQRVPLSVIFRVCLCCTVLYRFGVCSVVCVYVSGVPCQLSVFISNRRWQAGSGSLQQQKQCKHSQKSLQWCMHVGSGQLHGAVPESWQRDCMRGQQLLYLLLVANRYVSTEVFSFRWNSLWQHGLLLLVLQAA